MIVFSSLTSTLITFLRLLFQFFYASLIWFCTSFYSVIFPIQISHKKITWFVWAYTRQYKFGHYPLVKRGACCDMKLLNYTSEQSRVNKSTYHVVILYLCFLTVNASSTKHSFKNRIGLNGSTGSTENRSLTLFSPCKISNYTFKEINFGWTGLFPVWSVNTNEPIKK